MSEIVFNPPKSGSLPDTLQSQVENLQTTLASLNQQVIVLQEALQERDQKIADLQARLADATLPVAGSRASPCKATFMPTERSKAGEARAEKSDETLTIVGVLINLYNFILLPGRIA